MTADEEQLEELVSSYKSLEEAERKVREKRYQKIILISAVVLSLYAVLAFYILVFQRVGGITDNIRGGSEQTNEAEIENIIRRLDNLSDEVNSLEKYATSTTYTTNYLATKIGSIENRQEVIEQSILVDADKALTATLLREKQENLEESMIQLRERQTGLETKLDTIILAPLVLMALSFLIWLAKIFFKKKESGEE